MSNQPLITLVYFSLSFYSLVNYAAGPYSYIFEWPAACLVFQEFSTSIRIGSVLLLLSVTQSRPMNWKSSWLPFLFSFSCFLKHRALRNVKFSNSTRLVCCDRYMASIAIVCRLSVSLIPSLSPAPSPSFALPPQMVKWATDQWGVDDVRVGTIEHPRPQLFFRLACRPLQPPTPLHSSPDHQDLHIGSPGAGNTLQQRENWRGWVCWWDLAN